MAVQANVSRIADELEPVRIPISVRNFDVLPKEEAARSGAAELVSFLLAR